MISKLRIGDLEFEDYMAYVVPQNIFDRPKRQYDKVSVPGRSGDLVFDNKKYANQQITHTIIIMGNFVENFQKLSSDLLSLVGYQRVIDYSRPEEFRYGIVADDLKPATTVMHDAGRCEITLDYKPQRYLIDGEQAVEFGENGRIKNPTRFDAMPIVEVEGYGTVGIGEYFIEVLENPYDSIVIDCESMNALAGDADANNYISFVNDKQPVLHSEFNGIQLDDTITKVKITPRWWLL